MLTNKDRAVKDWLLTCPEVQADRLYFNSLKAENKSQGLILNATDKAKTDVCGNKIGSYDFTITDMRPMSNLPVGFSEEDLNSLADIQKIADWVNSTTTRPDFGENVYIEELYTYTDTPELAGIEQLDIYLLAKYMIKIHIEYFEKEK